MKIRDSYEFLISVVSRFAIVIGGVGINILMARYLGPEGLGYCLYVITFSALVSQFANLGISSSNTYFAARDESKLGKLAANSFWISFVFGTLCSVLGIIAVRFFFPEALASHPLIWFTLIMAPTSLYHLFAYNLLVGVSRITLFNVFQIIQKVLVFAAIIVAIFYRPTATNVLLAISASSLLSSILLVICLYRMSATPLLFFREELVVGVNYAFKAYLSMLTSFLNQKSAIFVVEYFCSEVRLSYFMLASQIIDTLYIVPTTLSMVIFPKLVKMPGNSWQATKKNALLVFVIMTSGSIFTFFTADFFISLLFGEKFLPAVPILLWMLPGLVFLSMSTIFSRYLCATGYPKEWIYLGTFMFFIFLSFSIQLVPLLGVIGGAASFSLTYFFQLCIIYPLCLWHRERISKKTSEDAEPTGSDIKD